MVGKVTVRGQGPVRRKQTTTTFKRGGRVHVTPGYKNRMKGGKPSARTRHIENEKEEIRRVDRNIRRNEGYKTGGRVKKSIGGRLIAGTGKMREYVKDIKDATKKMSPHQDPRSERSAKMRHSLDNPKKSSKTSSNPHSPDKKKRTLKDILRPRGGVKKKPSFKKTKKVLKAI